MTQDEVLQKLSASLINLQQRKGQLTLEQVEREVINLSCLEVLQNNDILRIDEITCLFINAAKHLVPQYGDAETVAAIRSVHLNVRWDGMWEFLKNYFQANHGIRIDDNASETKIFYSTRHERYEMNVQIANTPADRTIDFHFSQEKKVIIVNIHPTLSAKKGYLSGREGLKYIYSGSDADYRFTVLFDEIDEIIKFILEMPNRNLRIEYFE
jgi:hypothetical protein